MKCAQQKVGCRYSGQKRQSSAWRVWRVQDVTCFPYRKSCVHPRSSQLGLLYHFFFFFITLTTHRRKQAERGGLRIRGWQEHTSLALHSAALPLVLWCQPACQPSSLSSHTEVSSLLHPSPQRAALLQQRGVLWKRPLRFYLEVSEQGSVLGSLFGIFPTGLLGTIH